MIHRYSLFQHCARFIAYAWEVLPHDSDIGTAISRKLINLHGELRPLHDVRSLCGLLSDATVGSLPSGDPIGYFEQNPSVYATNFLIVIP